MAYYQQLRQAARSTRRKFMYDTTVGAGLPVIENLQNLMAAGDELERFSGILSGSLSYIFGKLDEGMSLVKRQQWHAITVLPSRILVMICLVWMSLVSS